MHQMPLLLESQQLLNFKLNSLLLEFVHIQIRVFMILPIYLGAQCIKRGFLWLWTLLRVWLSDCLLLSLHVDLSHLELFLHCLAYYGLLAFLVARLTPINNRLQHFDNGFKFHASSELSLGTHALLAQGAFSLAKVLQLIKWEKSKFSSGIFTY